MIVETLLLATLITPCREQPLRDGRSWAYRVVDGRKCWYPGSKMKPRDQLEWPDHDPHHDLPLPRGIEELDVDPHRRTMEVNE